MPNPLFSLIGDTVGGLVGKVTGLVDEVFTSKDEVNQFNARLAEIAEAAEANALAHAEVIANAQRDVIVAELNQDDKFTKRARPSLAYAGMLALFLNHIILPWVAFYTGSAPPTINLPPEFWWGWSGVVGAWAVGRSVEKRARINGEVPGKYTRMITGG